MGISRSAACAISYLMICREMTAADAICTVRLHRKFKFQTFFHNNKKKLNFLSPAGSIYPNEGFRKQLNDLCKELQREKRNASRYY